MGRRAPLKRGGRNWRQTLPVAKVNHQSGGEEKQTVVAISSFSKVAFARRLAKGENCSPFSFPEKERNELVPNGKEGISDKSASSHSFSFYGRRERTLSLSLHDGFSGSGEKKILLSRSRLQ